MYFPSICATVSIVDVVRRDNAPGGWATHSRRWKQTYRTSGDLVVAALAGHLEGDVVGGVALDLDGTGRKVVEVLVQELSARR